MTAIPTLESQLERAAKAAGVEIVDRELLEGVVHILKAVAEGKSCTIAAGDMLNRIRAVVALHQRPENAQQVTAEERLRDLLWVAVLDFEGEHGVVLNNPDHWTAQAKAVLAAPHSALERRATDQPRVTDNDKGVIHVSVNGHRVRDWIYENDEQRRRMMSEARWYVEGWCDGRKGK